MRAGVVGCLRRGNALDGAFAKLGAILRDLLFYGVGGERAENGTAAGKNPQRGADNGAAQNRCDHAFEVLLSRPQAGDLCDLHRALFFVLQVAYDLAQAEHSHGDGDEADAVGEFKNPEGKAWRAGIDVRANES